MRRVLKLNNIPIWNLVDLQREFSPMAAYDQLQEFCSFAGVHCVPLPQVLVNAENAELYAAKYVTKQFWFSILTRQNWPEDAASPEDCMDKLLRPLYEQEIGGREGADAVQGKTEQQRLLREFTDAAVSEKLKHIVKSAGLTNDAGDIRQAVTLLAICQLAEVNPLKQSFRALQPEKSAAAPEQKKSPRPQSRLQNQSKPQVEFRQTVTEFPFEKTAALAASGEPYCYWYHEEAEPRKGERIHTVCIKAQPGSRSDQVVRIALFSPTTGKCVQEITLKKGEFRYCNVSAGKIIGFLPDGAVSTDLCLLRDSYAADHYTVIPKDADAWKLNQRGITMAAAGTQQDGFLLLMDGKVSTAFYKPARDYMVQLQFDMIMMPVAELQLTADGCRLLLEDGTVVYNGKKEKNRCVTLSGSRAPLKALDDPAVSQLVLSEERDALVIFREDRQPQVCYDSTRFKLKADRHVQLL